MPKDDHFEDDDRPRSRRREDDDEDDEERPRRRRRRRSDDDDEDEGDDGLHYVIPINTSGLAIAAGYVGLISVLCLPAPIALLLGILALVQIKKNPKLHGKGRAIFAIVMGSLCSLGAIALIVIAIFANK